MQVTDRVKVKFLVNFFAFDLPLPDEAEGLVCKGPLITFKKNLQPFVYKIRIGDFIFIFIGQLFYTVPESLVTGNDLGLPVDRPDQVAGIVNDRPEILPVIIDLFLYLFLFGDIHKIDNDTVLRRVNVHGAPDAQRCVAFFKMHTDLSFMARSYSW